MNKAEHICVKRRTEFVVIFLAFLLLSILFVLNASNATSPLYPTYPIYELEKADQATFTIMGKHWFEDGKLPYVDLFDHKGPAIFFLNGLGWSLTGNVYGIALIQSLFIFAYCVTAYAALREKHGITFACVCVLFSLVMLRNVYGGGNTVEEIGLPIQMIALLGLCRWAGNHRAEHDPRWAFVYGVSIAFFILNRATDALCICSGCIVILVVLLRKKAYRNILNNAFAGAAGIIVTLLPFIVYFALHDALDAMWYGTIGYNVEYAGGNTAFWLTELDIKWLIELMIYCMPIWSIAIAGAVFAFSRCYRRAGMYLVMAVVSFGYLFSSRFYDHYVITYVPLFVAFAYELNVDVFRRQKCLVRICAAVMVSGIVLSTSALALRMEWNTRNDYKWSYVSDEKPYDSLMRSIPEEERDSVVLYNCIASIYLKYDINPVYTYFALQDWQGSQSEKLMGMIEEEFASCHAKWVLTHGGTSATVRNVLETAYEPVMTNENYTLHRLR